MKESLSRITLRVTKEEKEEIERRAAAEQKTVNGYIRDMALGSAPFEGKLRCDIMRYLCQLEVSINHTRPSQNYNILLNTIGSWKRDVLNRLDRV